MIYKTTDDLDYLYKHSTIDAVSRAKDWLFYMGHNQLADLVLYSDDMGGVGIRYSLPPSGWYKNGWPVDTYMQQNIDAEGNIDSPDTNPYLDFSVFDEGMCPECNGPIQWEFDCPGWGQEGHIMVCQGCGNAEEYRCLSDKCGWWYREPNRRSDKDKMGIRPNWLISGGNINSHLSEAFKPKETITIPVKFDNIGQLEPQTLTLDDDEEIVMGDDTIEEDE